MGQAYSSQHNSADLDEQNPDVESQSPTQHTTIRNASSANAESSSRARPLNSIRGVGAQERQTPRRSRFSPYGLFSRGRTRQQQPRPSAVPAVSGNLPEAGESRMSIDSVAAQPDAASAAPNNEPVNHAPSNWERSRLRMRAGNELMSRIVGRSIIASIVQEIERRRQNNGDTTRDALLEGVDRAALDYLPSASDRMEMYFRVSQFLQGILEGSLNWPEGSTAGTEETNNTPDEQPQPSTTANSDTTAEPAADSNRSESGTQGTSSPADSISIGTNFRMFLLPGAIEHVLEAYEREHGQPSSEREENEDEQTATLGGENSARAANEVEQSQASGGTANEQPYMRELTEDEQQRAEQQRRREEKLQRLRNIAQAMNDDRRTLQFPVVMLGVQLSSELQQQARAAIESLNDGAGSTSTSTSTSSTSLIAEESATETGGSQSFPASPEAEFPAMPPEDVSAAALGSESVQRQQQEQQPTEEHGGQSRGFFHRMNTILPNILDVITSLRRVHNAALRNHAGGNAAAQAGASNAQAQESSSPSQGSENQSGIAVVIMIHYLRLSNPMILPLVTQALFPELMNDSTGSSTASMQAGLAAGNNYDLFLEIANIIGQVTSTTVSQEIIDKKLAVYSFSGKVDQQDDGTAIARLVDGEEEKEVYLLSADRCPVCLDGFELGDLLRVLSCHHGLHKACGDAWFTQGANKCPVCRTEAVHG
ncbi:hypothetical protein IWW36_001471 [Coemansia brasiliensis]|uniref:RING-type domain-containing protein n=1 Tax=Coemansia brasiliensis TaxID=2650707 RepID=A0A9W8M0S5_9FUNG|nr:hypothetical protein IWW36_001471 [Coemansia brasiliensis]